MMENLSELCWLAITETSFFLIQSIIVHGEVQGMFYTNHQQDAHKSLLKP